MEKKMASQSRRDFLKASLAAPVAIGVGGLASAREKSPTLNVNDLLVAQAAAGPTGPLTTRPLGKTGQDVTILCLGGMMAALSPQYLDIAWSMGIRYFDTADCYLGGKSETIIGEWIKKYPERRKELFLATKDHPKTPEEMLQKIDTRLERCGTDYIDMMFIHGLNDREYGAGAFDIPKSKEWQAMAEQLKKSGKIRFFGFTCHDNTVARFLQSAAEGGFIDAVMLAYNPFFDKSDELDKALDACHEKGVGLVAMKTMRSVGDVPKRMPEFDKLGLTTHQAVLQACWNDERIASVCSMIDNVQMMQQNTEAARKYTGPLQAEQVELLRQLAMENQSAGMCPNCDGRCQKACGHDLAFNDIARFVSYYEKDGNLEARDMYLNLPEERRRAIRADLAAASDACLCKLDFAKILEKAERYFA